MLILQPRKDCTWEAQDGGEQMGLLAQRVKSTVSCKSSLCMAMSFLATYEPVQGWGWRVEVLLFQD